MEKSFAVHSMSRVHMISTPLAFLDAQRTLSELQGLDIVALHIAQYSNVVENLCNLNVVLA